MRDGFKVSLVVNSHDEIDLASATGKTKAANQENLKDKKKSLFAASYCKGENSKVVSGMVGDNEL